MLGYSNDYPGVEEPYYEIDFFNKVVQDLMAAGLDPNSLIHISSLFSQLVNANNFIAVSYLARHHNFVAAPADQTALQSKLDPLLQL